jgi:hypothetical protein
VTGKTAAQLVRPAFADCGLPASPRWLALLSRCVFNKRRYARIVEQHFLLVTRHTSLAVTRNSRSRVAAKLSFLQEVRCLFRHFGREQHGCVRRGEDDVILCAREFGLFNQDGAVVVRV